MESLSELVDMHQTSSEQGYSSKSLDSCDKNLHDDDDSDDKSMSQNDMQEGMTQLSTDCILQRDEIDVSRDERDKMKSLLSTNCIQNRQLKAADCSFESSCSVTAPNCADDSVHRSNVLPTNACADVGLVVNGQNSHDYLAVCDDSASTDALPAAQEVAEDWNLECDSLSKDERDLGVKSDLDMNLWLQGTLRHLHTNAALNENLIFDENDLDIDNEAPEEETVEVQEFLQEEEITEEAMADDTEDGSSKEDEKPLSYDLQQGFKILREIMGSNNKSITWAFIHAVDRNAIGCHDYYEKIKNPMWLMKMKEKFERREYENITEYVADMRLMLENCYRFNGLNHPISRNGEKLEQMMEQKLLLLSRELREKTSLAATSGKVVDIPITGTRRLKFSSATGTTTLLHRLRWEALEKEKEAKRQQQLEKKMVYEEFLKGLQAWEDRLFEEPLRQQMKAMWELPQIGQFLFLCQKALNLGEVSQYELECCLLLPRESSALQRIMTSLLSTPHQRARIQGKTLMSYRVWDERLRQLLRQWYKTYEDNGLNAKSASIKLGLDEKFFKIVGHKNPLERKAFHELTFYQKVWIVKSLCDHCLETQKSICEVMESQPLLDLKESILGRDNDGNVYIHFPQFCGEDLRIYRQSPQALVFELPNNESTSCAKAQQSKRHHRHKGKNSTKKFTLELPDPPSASATPRTRDSRLRQNPRQVQSYKVTGSSSSSDTENASSSTEDDDDREEEEEDGEIEEEEEEENAELDEELDEGRNEQNEDEKNDGDDDGGGDDDDEKISLSETEIVTQSKSVGKKEQRRSRKIRGRRKRCKESRNIKEEEAASVKSTPDSWDALGDSGAVIPRRSLRKIIEESKKDAVSSPASCGRTPLRRSSFSSSSSATLSRSGLESASSCLQSSSKKDYRGGNQSGKRKRESSGSEAEDDYDDIGDDNVEESTLSASAPRMTTRSNVQRRKVEKAVEPKDGKSQSRSLARRSCPEPLELGRITRNLYKILLEAKIDVHGDDTRQMKDVEVSSRSSSKKGVRSSKNRKYSVEDSSTTDEASRGGNSEKSGKGRKKRSCLTTVSKAAINADANGVEMGDSLCSFRARTDVDSGLVVNKGSSLNVESFQDDTGQGDSKIGISLNKSTKSGTAVENEDLKGEVEAKERVEGLDLKQLGTVTIAEDNSTGEKLQKISISMENHSTSDDFDKKFSLGTVSEMKSVESPPKEELSEEKDNLQSTSDNTVKLKEEEACGLDGLECKVDATKIEATNKEVADPDAEEVCEILGPVIGPFELIVSSIEGLRTLVDKFADKEEKDSDSSSPHHEDKESDAKVVYRKRCTVELHKRLSFLLQEVGVYEPRLIKLNKRKMIRLRKEQENYKEEPENQQAEDLWENNDSTSWASNGNTEAANDESSVDAESSSSIRTEDKSDETQKKSRPSRGKQPAVESLLSSLPAALASEVASLLPGSNSSCGAVNTRKRAAMSRGKAPQSAKKAKVKSGCAESVTVLVSSDGGLSASSSAPQNVKDSVLRGLMSRDANAKKQPVGVQLAANVSAMTGSQFNRAFEKQLPFQLGPRSAVAPTANLTARLIVSLPSAVPNLPSAMNRVLPNRQSSLQVALGQTLQPLVQQNVVRLSTSSGSNVQFLTVSNLNQLSPSILQQLLNSQNLVMVAPSAGVRSAAAAGTISTVAPSSFVHNRLAVPGNSTLTAASNIQHVRPSGVGQIRPLSLQNLPFAVVTRSSVPAAFNSFQHAVRSTITSVPGYVLPSQVINAGVAAVTMSARLNTALVGSTHTSPSSLDSSLLRPLLTQNSPNINLPAGDRMVQQQKYTNSLTVRALLGNRNIADQVQNLLPCSSFPASPGTAFSPSSSGSDRPFTAAIGGSSSLVGTHLVDDRLIGRTVGGNSVVCNSASAGLIVRCAGAVNPASLSLPNSLSPVLQPVNVNLNSPRCNFKDERVSVNVDPAMQLSVIAPGGLEPGHSLPVIQHLGQNTLGLKFAATSGVGQPQHVAIAALVSAADQTKQILLVSPEQASAIARKNLVDQAVRAAITGPISTSLPTANLEIPSSLGMPPAPRIVNTHTTTVMKSPIPALPQLFNNSLSPNKTVGQSSLIASPAPASRIVTVVPQSSISAVPLQLPIAGTAATSQAAVPILLNSAIVMPGSRNVLLLQQAPVQLLSLDANRPGVVGQTPFKLAAGGGLPHPTLPCNQASGAQYSYNSKNPGAPMHVPFAGASNHFMSNRTAQPALSSARLVHGSVSATGPLVPQNSTHQAIVSPTAPLLQIVQPSGNKITPNAIAVSNLAAVQQLLQVNQVKRHPDAAQVVVAAAAAAGDAQVPSSRPAFKIVIPPKYDGIPLGQLPIQGGIRLFNRLPAGLVAVGGPQSDTGSSQPQEARAAVTVSPHENIAAVRTVAAPAERSLLLLQTTGVSNSLATAFQQQTARATQSISQKLPVLQMQTNALNVANLKGQLVQFAVQPHGGGAGGDTCLPDRLPTQLLQQPVLQVVVSKEGHAEHCPTSVHPFSQSSRGIAGTQSLLPTVSQGQYMSADSGLKISHSSSSLMDTLHTFAASQAPVSPGMVTQPHFPSSTRMNLEVAANWLLQAASVVDNSPNSEPDSSDKIPVSEVQPSCE